MVDIKKHHKFFSENFTVEISTPVEYSTKNWFLDSSKNAKNGHLTAKNTIFQRFQPLLAQYLGFGQKWPIDTLYITCRSLTSALSADLSKIKNLLILSHFSSFFTQKYMLKKTKVAKWRFWLLNEFFHFPNQIKLVWEVKKGIF